MTTPTEVKPSTPPATPPAATPPATPPAAKDQPPAPASKPASTPAPAPVLAAAAVEPPPAPKSEAPEKYEFTLPENVNIDPGVVALYETVARDVGLSQEAAQKTLERVLPQIAQSIDAAAVKRLETLSQEVAAHPKLGGANLDQTLANAKLALERLGNPRLRALIRDPRLGVGSDVGLVEFLDEIARRFLRGDDLLREERRGSPPATVADDEDYSARYPKMTARLKAGR